MVTVHELLAWISALRRSELRRRCSRQDCPTPSPTWRALRQDGILLQGSWCCGPECLERALLEGFRKLLASSAPATPVSYRVPLGLLMLSRGTVDRESLEAALNAQRKAGHGKIGDWLRNTGKLSEYDLIRALGTQWACPALIADQHIETPPDLVPQPLIEVYQMLPVRWVESSATLYLGFADHINYRALYGLEQMLACETKPCVLAESTLKRHLQRMHRDKQIPISNDKTGSEIAFENVNSAREMASITRSYAVELGADEARYVLCDRYVWVRLHSDRRPALVGDPGLTRHRTTNLLFEVSGAASEHPLA
jgi:hypothetical protein